MRLKQQKNIKIGFFIINKSKLKKKCKNYKNRNLRNKDL